MRRRVQGLWRTGQGLACGALLAACPTTSESVDSAGEATTGALPDATTGDGAALADCRTLYTEFNQQTERGCMCLVADGTYSDPQTCLAEALPEPVDCLCPLLAGDPANAAFLACAAAAELEFSSCIAPVDCEDVTGFDACLGAYLQATQGCGAPSKRTLGQTLVTCHGVEAFPCGSGEQVPADYACDDEPDCPDMSDEADAICRFPCGSGETIETSRVCDGVADCADMSDELKAMCVFPCDGGTTEIPKEWVCDGEADCADEADEAMCLARPRPPAAVAVDPAAPHGAAADSLGRARAR